MVEVKSMCEHLIVNHVTVTHVDVNALKPNIVSSDKRKSS